MPTNYYLRRDPQNCGECGHPKRDAEIHIGKHSGGWVFTWQGLDAGQSPAGGPLVDAETWGPFLEKEVADGATIWADNGGYSLSLTEFFEDVERQRGLRRQSLHYPDGGRCQAAGPDDVAFGEWE